MINWIIAIVAVAIVVFGIVSFVRKNKNHKDCGGNCSSGCSGCGL
ncbi:MAG: FeoB-associated Cys-rich membrane protein [Sphaerochaetaceae bacterium]|jgi:hypothetical protein|nr:FeoB-associated Cys-rich membrane protein [Sphaerochaetaceae bacterium]MDC7237183.1 FeoB-associated Cys-rich membrane protein [Sphaerochaetaceae bacterium]MDC7250198.1 FeoB-associated Cys-rich membrane protein [Sphaerochaetaceae bacterium]